jgi:hypothetical protein
MIPNDPAFPHSVCTPVLRYKAYSFDLCMPTPALSSQQQGQIEPSRSGLVVIGSGLALVVATALTDWGDRAMIAGENIRLILEHGC